MPTSARAPAPPAPGTWRRSAALLRAFRDEQTDPDAFYGLLAADTVQEVGRFAAVEGATVLDVGGGPGYFAEAFSSAGARYCGIDPSVGETTARGRVGAGAVLASGTAIPMADGTVDLAISSNVLEHVPDPHAMGEEMLRVTRPGGVVWLSWTTWLSPWGGHETSPWHYLGGRRAADRYAHRTGRRPKNDYGRTLFALSAGTMIGWAGSRSGAEVVSTYARYHPRLLRRVVDVPGVREVVAWNVVIVLRRCKEGG